MQLPSPFTFVYRARLEIFRVDATKNREITKRLPYNTTSVLALAGNSAGNHGTKAISSRTRNSDCGEVWANSRSYYVSDLEYADAASNLSPRLLSCATLPSSMHNDLLWRCLERPGTILSCYSTIASCRWARIWPRYSTGQQIETSAVPSAWGQVTDKSKKATYLPSFIVRHRAFSPSAPYSLFDYLLYCSTLTFSSQWLSLLLYPFNLPRSSTI